MIEEVSGTVGKFPVKVEVISPMLVRPAEHTEAMEDLLAGDFLAGFGGLLDEKLRRSDFMLGYRSMLMWMERIANSHRRPEVERTAGSLADPDSEALLQDFVARAFPIVHDMWLKLPDRTAMIDVRAKRGALRWHVEVAGATRPRSLEPWRIEGPQRLGPLPLAAQWAFCRLVGHIGWVVLYERVLQSFPDRFADLGRRLAGWVVGRPKAR